MCVCVCVQHALVHAYVCIYIYTGKDLDDMIREVDGDSDMALSMNEFMTMIGMAKVGRIGKG